MRTSDWETFRPSIFPFLGVLLCILGCLLMVLIAVVILSVGAGRTLAVCPEDVGRVTGRLPHFVIWDGEAVTIFPKGIRVDWSVASVNGGDSICQTWANTEDFSETRAIAVRESDFHAEQGEGINSLIGLFVWGIPILGFIGTVLGIALAVGSFSSFLGGNVDDVAQIKIELIDVTKGLAFAFNTTLLGLLCSLVLMLMSVFGRGLERRVIQETSLLCVRDTLFSLRKPVASRNE